MPFCTECGVEVDKYVTNCPLCDSPVTDKLAKAKTRPGIYPHPQKKLERLDSGIKTKLAREILNFSLLVSTIIILIIDFLISGAISWSRYIVASLFLFAIITNGFFYVQRRALIVAPVIIVSLAVFLLLLDFFDGRIEWFTIIGLPVLLLLSVVIVFLVLYIKLTHNRGLNIPAAILLSIVIICIGVDLLITFYNLKTFALSWSLIVGLSSVLPALVMLFIHYRIKKIDLRKTFDI